MTLDTRTVAEISAEFCRAKALECEGKAGEATGKHRRLLDDEVVYWNQQALHYERWEPEDVPKPK